MNTNQVIRFHIRLFIVFFIAMLMLTATGVVAQTSKTIAKTCNIGDAAQLQVNLKGKVEVIETNASRIIIECTFSVKHSKSDAIVYHIYTNQLLETVVSVDNSSRVVKIDTPELKPMIVDNKDVDVSTSYKIYVPKSITILQ